MENVITSRFDAIMALVDAWSAETELYDCRCDAVDTVLWALEHPEYSAWTDDEIADEAKATWLMCE